MRDGELIGHKTEENFNQPRLEELARKERDKNISDEERAELFGLRIFPQNPRGAELRRRQVLGILTEDENEELKGLFREKLKEEHYSLEVRQLIERVEAGDPNVKMVGMDDGAVIEVGAGDEEEKAILTRGLLGCFGTLVFTEHKNGTRTAMITHYNPLALSKNMRKYEMLAKANTTMEEAYIKKAVYIMVGDKSLPENAENEEERVICQQQLFALETALKAQLGGDIEIKVVPYSTELIDGAKDQGVLFMKLPPAGKGDPRYKTWFSEEKF